MRNPKKGKKKAKKPSQQAGTPSSSNAAQRPKEAAEPSIQSVWRAGADPIEEGETLQYDPTAYDCLHQLSLEWPSLSFDVIKDGLGAPRSTFPHEMYLVAGTQAATAQQNSLTLLRLTNLGQGEHGKLAAAEDDDGDDMSSDEEDEDPPVLHTRAVAHFGAVNRLRVMPQRPGVVASWSDQGLVQVWDFTSQLQSLAEAPALQATRNKGLLRNAPLQMHRHRTEGYALDWSPLAAGQLASGDNSGAIHVWTQAEGALWQVGQAMPGHTGSVEDIQWSPSEATVFASCSADGTIRFWDTRKPGGPQLTIPKAHENRGGDGGAGASPGGDINVIAWNALVHNTMASGCDDGSLRIWDLSMLKEPVAHLAYHQAKPSPSTSSRRAAAAAPDCAITSVEWSPHESAVLAASSADNQLTVWDLAVERDPEEEAALGPSLGAAAAVPEDLPPQLMFVHAGQTDIKEVHWHAQIPGMLVSTAADGFNVFKPANI